MNEKINDILNKSYMYVLLYWLPFIIFTTYTKLLKLFPMQIIEQIVLAISIALILQGFRKLFKDKYQFVLLFSAILQSTFVMYWWSYIIIDYTLYLIFLIFSSLVVSLINHLVTRKMQMENESILKAFFLSIVFGFTIFIIAYFQIFFLYFLF